MKPYRFSCGESGKYFSVKEPIVHDGRTVRGPTLCPEGS
jgi:hypothetical protein